MIQPYLILAASTGLAGLLYRRYQQVIHDTKHQREFEREKRRIAKESRGQNELRARLTLEEQSSKIQDSLAKVSMFLRKADMYYAREDWNETEKYLVQALALDEHNIKAYRLLGLTYLQQGEWKKAELIYQQLIEMEPTEASHYGNLGLALYYSEKYETAREAYEAAITRDSKKPSRYISLGQVCLRLGDHTAAIKSFQHAVQLDKRNIEYLLALAEALEETGDSDAALKTYEKILDISPYNEAVRDRVFVIKNAKHQPDNPA